MPNKSIYISDEDVALFQKATDLAGESLSKVVVESLRQYVNKKEMEGNDYRELIVWRGEEESQFNSLNVQKFKFIGRLISQDCVDETEYTGKIVNLYLFGTVKGKFLLWRHINDGRIIEYNFDTYDEAKALYSNVLTPKMLAELEAKLGKAHITFMDI